MRGLDFTSWQTVVSTLFGLVVVSLVAVGIRLLVLQGVQQRRERQNRQINERLKTLIAAYKTLGGSFTGDLAVDPRHLRDVLPDEPPGFERRRRVRDAVEAALSDVVLLGTETQVRLAVRAVEEMVAGRSVELAELVVSLRDFIRDALDLAPIPTELAIPRQGPIRVGASAGRGGRGGGADADAAGRGGARGGGGTGAGGLGLGFGAAGAVGADALEDAPEASPHAGR